MFWIAEGHEISDTATSYDPDNESCWGSKVVNCASVLFGNVAIEAFDTKFIVKSWGCISASLFKQLPSYRGDSSNLVSSDS